MALDVTDIESRHRFLTRERKMHYATAGRRERIICHWANLFRIGPLLSIGHLAHGRECYAISHATSAI